jgi:hypothetical protein
MSASRLYPTQTPTRPPGTGWGRRAKRGAGTHKFQRSWLDFVVVEENGVPKAKRIGAFYYAAIVVNAMLAAGVSLLWG